MIVRFLRDNWNELGTKTRAVVAGVAVTAAAVLGSALLQLSTAEAIDLREWLRTLLLAEAGALGSILLGNRKLSAGNIAIRRPPKAPT